MSKSKGKQLKLPKVDKGNGKNKGQTFANVCPHCRYLTCQCHRIINQRPIIDTRPTAEVTASKNVFKEALKNKFIKHHIGMPSDEELIDGNNYVVGTDGLYLIVKNKIGKFVTKTDKVPFVETTPVEGFHMSLDQKMPYDMLLQTIAFFKKVMSDKGNAEAMVQILMKPDGLYFLHVADQEVSGAMVRFKRDEEIEATNTLILDIHSHNTMGAFFSGTDNADEKEARVYGVIGQLNKEWPEMKFRAGNGSGGWIDLDMFQVFETPEIGTDVPEEWMAKVHKPGSGVFGEHTRHPQPQHTGHNPWDTPYPWKRKLYSPGEVRFGGVDSPERDLPTFPSDGDLFTRWEDEVGYEGCLPSYLEDDGYRRGNIGEGINALVEALEITNDDEAKGIAIAFIEKLDCRAKDILHEILGSVK